MLCLQLVKYELHLFDLREKIYLNMYLLHFYENRLSS